MATTGRPPLPASALGRDRAGGAHDIVVVAAPASSVRLASMFLVGLPNAFSLPLVLLFGDARDDDRERLVTLRAHSALPVRLVEDKDPIVPSRVHLAPADYHLFIEGDHFALSTEAPVKGARPSIDALFKSVADAFGARAVCVLLGRDEDVSADGRAGAARVRARGGLVIVEHPETAAVDARASGADGPPTADTVLHLSQIAPFVSTLSSWEAT